VGSRPIDWPRQQITILKEAGELELMDEYIEKLRARGRMPETLVAGEPP
jgi:hypothetical protein